MNIYEQALMEYVTANPKSKEAALVNALGVGPATEVLTKLKGQRISVPTAAIQFKRLMPFIVGPQMRGLTWTERSKKAEELRGRYGLKSAAKIHAFNRQYKKQS